jgi:hypothetical protein
MVRSMNENQIEKVKNVARTYFAPEKGNASRILAAHDVYIDIAGIEWTKEQIMQFHRNKRIFLFGFDPLNNELV